MEALAFGTLALSAVLAMGSAVRADEPNRLVTILTAPEPQTQLMTMDAMGAAIVADDTTVMSF